MDTGGLNIDLEALAKANDIRSIAKLHNSKHLLETLKKVQEFLDKPLNKDFSGPVENHPEYSLVVTANKLLVDIENEIVVVHKFIRDQYQEKFPELESLVPNAMDYVRTVKLIGNETVWTIEKKGRPFFGLKKCAFYTGAHKGQPGLSASAGHGHGRGRVGIDERRQAAGT